MTRPTDGPAAVGHDGRVMSWLGPGLRSRRGDLVYLVGEGLRSVVALAAVLVAAVCAPFVLFGLGWVDVPRAVGALDRHAGAARRRAGTFVGVPVTVRERDLAGPSTAGQRLDLLTTPQTRREAGWLAVSALLPFTAAVAGVAVTLSPLTNIVAPLLWWAFPPDRPVVSSFDVTSWPLALGAVAIGVVYLVLGWYLVPWMARAIARLTLALAGPRRSVELAERVQALTASRAAALDAHAAELRRIERDLHDGAQNRLVGVVMMLGLARRALETDPGTAAGFLDRAADAAGDALAGLRAVVHDVYPPVLDELGLGGAATALAGRCPVPCTLGTAGLRRAPAAVESAAYFVLAEALTNVARHSGASRASVRLRTEPRPGHDVLVVEVTDDGRGGADPGAGTGLAGIARRVAAFDGILDVHSPPGGPTTLRAELVCGS